MSPSSSAAMTPKRKRHFKAGEVVKIRMGQSVVKVQVLDTHAGTVRVALNNDASACSPPSTFVVTEESIL